MHFCTILPYLVPCKYISIWYCISMLFKRQQSGSFRNIVHNLLFPRLKTVLICTKRCPNLIYLRLVPFISLHIYDLITIENLKKLSLLNCLFDLRSGHHLYFIHMEIAANKFSSSSNRKKVDLTKPFFKSKWRLRCFRPFWNWKGQTQFILAFC